MHCKWLIETTSIPEDTEPLIEALKKQNIEYTEVNRDQLYSKDFDFYSVYPPDKCVLFFGSLEIAKRVRKETTWTPGVYYNAKAFDCISYYPHFGDLLLNCDYAMFPYGDLARQKEFIYDSLGEARTIFLRPAREDKIFTGKLIFKEHFDKEIESLGYGQIAPYEIVIAARPINLIQEWRFVCVNGNVITGSSYKKNNLVGYRAGYTDEAFNTAQQAAEKYCPDRVWIIDVGLTKGGRHALVEVGCFSCAGLYKCDRDLVVSEVSKAAEQDWEYWVYQTT